MYGTFDDDEDEQEPFEPKQDTELTLGPLGLLGLFFALALLCGLSFGLGYKVGHRGVATGTTAPQPAAASPSAATIANSHTKPLATLATTMSPKATAQVGSEEHDAAGPEVTPTGPEAGPAPAVQTVKPALPEPTNAKTAVAAGSGWMVQIAAVSQREDAQVLVDALRNKGYQVSVNGAATDRLLHVRVGPFASHDEAYRWRQKLMNDGYNAIVQQ
jgi:cell division septation protein DedD